MTQARGIHLFESGAPSSPTQLQTVFQRPLLGDSDVQFRVDREVDRMLRAKSLMFGVFRPC